MNRHRYGIIIIVFLVAVGCATAATPIQEASAQPRPPSSMSMGPVATVGHSKIAADQVFELWTPVWYETLAKVRNGKMSASEGDSRLDREWQRVVRALVKDEVFFIEAEREHNSFINTVADNIMRQGADRPRNQVVAEIRRVMQQDMEKYFRILNAELIKESGGMLKLHKVLEGRGLTFQEWQSRLKKKAFTQSYLQQILKPRVPNPGPRQIQEYYTSHPDEFSQPGLVRFRHIFFSNTLRGEEQARNDAIEVWEKLMDNELSFAEAAKKHSDDAESRDRGGMESGEEAVDPEREAWLSDIRTALKEESPNTIGPILESPFGCHVAQLVEIGQERKTPFAEVRKDIERKLQNAVWEAETDRYFTTIRKNAEIRVIIPTFPPHLSCAVQTAQEQTGPKVYHIGNPDMKIPKR